MKRLHLVLACTLTAGLLAPVFARAATPCPPPSVSVKSGTTAATPCPSGASYTTNFAATENPISEGGQWVDGKAAGLDWNNPLTTAGHAVASVKSGLGSSRYDDSIAHLSSNFAANQYAQGTVYRAPGYAPNGSKHEIELLLHFSITAHHAHGYEVTWGWDGDFAIVRWNGLLGDYTVLYVNAAPGPGQLVDGDVVRAEIIGNVIKVYKNGGLVATAPADTTWPNGQPGMGFWPVDSSIKENYGWTSYQAGSL